MERARRAVTIEVTLGLRAMVKQNAFNSVGHIQTYSVLIHTFAQSYVQCYR